MKKEKEVTKKETKKVTKKVAKKTTKKESLFKKIGNYFKNVKVEMKKVKWATKKDLLQYSLITLIFVFIFAIYFGLLDIVIAAIKTGIRGL